VGSIGTLFALFVVGYLLGVWTACLVLHQRQDDDEVGSDGVPGLTIDPFFVEGAE
jgi:hypothetical protein